MANLMLHCGAYRAEKNEVLATQAPHPTRSHFPIDHSVLISEAEKLIEKSGYMIKTEAHALSHEENRYFGLYELESTISEVNDYNPVAGLRNSHDKVFAAGLVCGKAVFVCDNLSFSGDYKFSRKHTKNAYDETLSGMAEVFSQLPAFEAKLKQRTDLYKEFKVNRDISKFIIQCAKRRIIAPNQIMSVYDEWEEPKDAFGDEPRTLWRLTNAFTSVMKQKRINVFRNAPATLKLDEIVQEHFGIESLLS